VLVAIHQGGICGSDLHYYRHGGFGTVRLRQPMILGHEIAGRVVALGAGTAGPPIGTLVAVNPSTPCGKCSYCRQGLPIHCLDMRFLGSAMRMPHVQGGFAEYVVCDAANAVAMPDGVDPAMAAFAEPLAVCLHAVAQAPVRDARVLIMGAGPIGLLLLLAVRFAGAGEVMVTDILDKPLLSADMLGADRSVNVATHPEALAACEAEKGYFDVVFEAAGQPQTIATALRATRPRGTIVLVGQGGAAEMQVSTVVGKEISLRGSFRFASEFAHAVELIADGRIDVRPLLSAVIPAADADGAFRLAADKSQSIKVQLAFQ